MVVFKRALAPLTLILILATISPADVVDRVVAIVNNDVITLSEVNQEGKALLQRVAENVSPSDLSEALKTTRQKIIEQLIEKKIMLQEAEKASISVSDEEADMAYQRIRERSRLTPEQFQKQLAAAGMNEAQYKENLKTQVLSSKLVNQEIRSKVIIPEDKIIDYYDTHYTERVGEGGYYLLQIGISWDENAPEGSTTPSTRETAKQKAEVIRDSAVQGEDFRDLAEKHSSLPSSVDGGDIGVFKGDDMSPEMLETISRTKPGEISTIIETSSGFQFFKVLSSQEGQIVTKVSYDSVKDEIHEILYQQEMEARYLEWLKEMKSRAYIKVL